MKKLEINKIAILLSMTLLTSAALYGCNSKSDADPEVVSDTDSEDDKGSGDPVIDLLINGEAAGNNGVNTITNDATLNPDIANNDSLPSEEDDKEEESVQPVVNTNVINNDHGGDSTVTIAPQDSFDWSQNAFSSAYIPPEENRYSSDDETREATPQFFDVGPCYVDVPGQYSVEDMKMIIDLVNAMRKEYKIPLLTMNTSLCKVADVRAKELTYIWGHIRPDFSYWNTVAPDYFQAELIACARPEQGAEGAVNQLFNATTSRMKALDEDYTMIGASSFTCDGLVYIVVSFGY